MKISCYLLVCYPECHPKQFLGDFGGDFGEWGERNIPKYGLSSERASKS